jgi:thiamine monophosphate kinase
MVPEAMAIYALIFASTLARAHARSGDRIAIAGYIGKGSLSPAILRATQY